MNEFKEKWSSNPRFKTKIKLLLYTLFVIFVAIFAISNRPPITPEGIKNEYNNSFTKEENNDILEIPKEYSYTINITINNDNYRYEGTKTLQRESITKEVDNIITNYIYENNSYYKEIDDNYILCTKEDVYDVVNYNYINLETIKEYLSKSNKEGNQYLIYLKDIILGNNSNDYIVITVNKDNVDIDYTSLMKNFDITIDRYLIGIDLENIE